MVRMHRDPIFHENTPSSAPRPVCSAAFPMVKGLSEFWLNLDSVGSVM
jgi:hypothetical protein